ncbi:MAG: hypothetical protein WA728_00385 [Xanthobacteraceae bacterium]
MVFPLMKRLVIVLLVSVVAAAPGQATDYATMGVGTRTCGEFRSTGTAPEAAAYFNWALGFMSGLNTIRLASGWVTKNMASMSMAEQEMAILKYCDEHPLGSFHGAVMVLFFSLKNSDYRSSHMPAVASPASQQ